MANTGCPRKNTHTVSASARLDPIGPSINPLSPVRYPGRFRNSGSALRSRRWRSTRIRAGLSYPKGGGSQALTVFRLARGSSALQSPESIYWVGFITAVTVRMELGDLRRFERARQLSAFAGLSPRQFESGTSVRKRTRMSEAGSKRVRKVLYMAACSAIAHPSARRSEYDSLKDNGENPWKASARSCEKYWSL